MNKTIIININGIVFHIEEDAYEILKNYMTEVKRHFMDSADSLEITTDIENRIAEMFSELLQREGKQVIVEQDVTTIIEQMGTVADFEHADEEEKNSANPFAYKNSVNRRLFRDRDDHLVSGVCAGIANYFDIDPVWIRLAFAVFAFVGGTGLLLYIILWVVVPKAVTRADKMAMKGEKQNLAGFAKNLEDELSTVRHSFSNFGTEAKPFVYKARDFAGDFFTHLGAALRVLLNILIKLVGIFVILVCFGFIVFSIIAFVAAVGFGNMHMFPMTPFSLLHNRNAKPIFICGLVVAVIPLLSIIIATLRGIFKVGSVSYFTGTSALIVWIMAVGGVTYYAVKISDNFKESAGFTQTINLKPTKNNTYYIRLNDIKYFSHEDSVRLDIKSLFHDGNITVIDEDENDELHNIYMDIERADVNKPVLVETYKARGRDFDAALRNARASKYIFGQKDTVLTFDYKLRNIYHDDWHDEELGLILKIPMNARVVIDRDVDRILRNNSVWDCNSINKRNNDNVKSATFIMTDNGLQCKVDTLVTLKKDSLKKSPLTDSSQTEQ